MHLSIIIPCLNEGRALPEIVRRASSVPLPGVRREIVVVDDGSTDDSIRRLVEQATPGVRVLRHPRNRGKGAAVRTGLAAASGDVVLLQDADLEYDPADYPRLLAPIAAGRADAAFGTRFRFAANRFRNNRLINRWLTFLWNLLYGAHLTDMETCYKAFRRDALDVRRLRADRFDIEPEIASALARRGRRIAEIPIRYAARSWAEGKKITWRDALHAVFFILIRRLLC